jgi:formate dehydrogenase gamma subunit
MKRRRTGVVRFFAVLVLAVFGGTAFAQQTDECMECHSDPTLVRETPSGPETLYVDLQVFQNSIHGGLECTDCHQGIEELPHAERLEAVNCGTCHEEIYRDCSEGVHGREYSGEESDVACCSDCHGTHNILPVQDPGSLVYPANQAETCAKCHSDPDFVRRHGLPKISPPDAYKSSVHYQAFLRGISNAPSCFDCHGLQGSHKILPLNDPASPVHRENIPGTCGRCHQKITVQYMESIHGQRLQKGISMAPTCVTCHGEHVIQSPLNPESPTYYLNVSKKVCSPCHQNEVLNERYGLPKDRVVTYANSYHGLAVERGSKTAANCISCHGIHDIFDSADPRSRVNVANLEKTCGQCHPGASTQFTQVKVHTYRTPVELKAADIIRSIYTLLIVVTIGGMILHNLIVFLFYIRRKYRQIQVEPTVTRFNRSMVLQHAVLVLSFTTLVITGFALKFPDWMIFKLLLRVGLDEAARSLIHRIAGTVLVIASFYHLFWIFFNRHGRKEFRSMLPSLQDLYDLRETVQYYLGKRRERPQYDQYNYIEKAEYWALIWGTVVMAVTGLILWFPVWSARLFGAWVVPIAELIHLYEAILATLAILVWHMFWVIFYPEEYPMSLVWLTGKMPREEVEHSRRRWLEKMTEEEERESVRIFE